MDSPAGKIGIGTCYDLRFPELARMEALQGAQVMLYPSAWVKGENKFMQWETLLRARAIENEMYVLGAVITAKNTIWEEVLDLILQEEKSCGEEKKKNF